ncbi:MAG: alpha/beta hydrolase [Candidatus Woesearchaeota archaeon]|nr:alpha/beta hydrolase [Candidatus Woesearchaeota archaeon]
MVKSIFVVHGWGASPESEWRPWLKLELEQKGFVVHLVHLPTPDAPEIKTWLGALKKAVSQPDKETFFVGHSIGCQTILRYLESLPKGVQIGGAVFVAGWFRLSDEIKADAEQLRIATPWLETSIDLDKVCKHTEQFVAFLSDNDPWVPLAENKELFERFAKVIVEHNKGHYSEDDGMTEVPQVLKEVLKISEKV